MHNGSCTDALRSTLSTAVSTMGTKGPVAGMSSVPADSGRAAVPPTARAAAARTAHRAAQTAARTAAQARELEFLMRAVSSVTWLKIARRSFMSSLIFLFACMTVV